MNRMGRNKVSPISTPSVVMAVIADEENVITTKTKNDLHDHDAPQEHDEIVSSSTSRWTICLVAGLIVLAAVVTISAAIPMTSKRETEVAALHMTYDSIDQSREKPMEETIMAAVEDDPEEDTEILTSPDRSAITTISATSSTTPALTTTTTSLEEEGDATSAAATTSIVSNTSTTSIATTVISTTSSAISTVPSTATSVTTTVTENSNAGIDLLIGTKWKALEIRWLKGSLVEELKEATEEDRNPITLYFDSESSVSGTCGNNRCWNTLELESGRISLGIFRRTRMIASEQETNYVSLLQGHTFYYEVQDEQDSMPELHLYETIIEDGIEKRGRLMATYVKLSEESV